MRAMFGFFKKLGRDLEMEPKSKDPYGLEGATSIFNLRELAGYPGEAGPTLPHRFLRSGALDAATEADCAFLKDYGVCRVVDLRGTAELAHGDGLLAQDPNIAWINVPLFDYNMSDPYLMPRTGTTGYLAESYCTILANKPAMKEIFEFFAEAEADDCILFHCAAGMDRTGVTSMLLLGLCGVDRAHIICDYSYSFGDVREVDKAVMSGKPPEKMHVRSELKSRIKAISETWDLLIAGYGSADTYLDSCGIMPETRRAVREHLES
ncbi:MAG: protein-tyrosine-phosphatase [Coriobacteriaceae bacterium]|uniref:tyrosine-protein phosphatase n=1 Tax=Atopobium sp. oral taxon 416 TaxID=712157 RepID=UPI000FEEB337|nr:tyrosine-protein phosphatase [Atopobium sp. oral taxon 416]QUC04217.1 tyrosine-protein phosphatase [Atopobium sp. oral taxon 416]RRF89828.1 MAG: protein-tyrosine-phosphatase [Coriobacteriaceae bacterium]